MTHATREDDDSLPAIPVHLLIQLFLSHTAHRPSLESKEETLIPVLKAHSGHLKKQSVLIERGGPQL